MKLDTFPVEVSPALNGLGASVAIRNFHPCTIQFQDKAGGGAFDGTYQVEGSVDGMYYAPIGAPVTANGFVNTNGYILQFVRVKTTVAPTTALTKPTVVLAGLNHQTF